MRIAHLCLSCFYIDKRAYQENELVRQHVNDGHEVVVLASTEIQSHSGELTYIAPAEYMGEDGARVVRLAYHPQIPTKIAPKLRIFKNLYAHLEAFRPDVILFHGTCGWELLTVARYVQGHPQVVFYVDAHEDTNNSARTFLSREILHKRYYGPILRYSLPHVKKILCVTTEAIDFVAETYRINRKHLEFYPLGGHPVTDGTYQQTRARVRADLGIEEGQVVLLQAGKQTRRKKLIETLVAFSSATNPDLRLLIAGSIDADINDKVLELIARDRRVRFLGWKSSVELNELLCATDVYVQPGTQSVTMQQSLCCRCAVILDDVPAHAVYFRGNGWLIRGNDDLQLAFRALKSADLTRMQDISFAIATEMLDYRRLAQRVLT